MFLAAEADPFVKVGGLGDVAGALPRALRSLPSEVLGDVKLDIRLVLPLHSAVRTEALRPLTVYSIPRGQTELQVEAFETSLDGLPVYFITGDPIRNSGSVYSSSAVEDGEKYSFFSLAALDLPRQLNWNVDLIHANDWHTALAAYGNLTKRWEQGTRKVASIITLHNLPFMGPDISEIVQPYNLPLAQTDLPEWARILPLPLGLWASDAIVPVSPGYAEEILGREFGCGLQDFLNVRRATLHGILNGIDTVAYDPRSDAALAAQFSSETLERRARNKAALQERVGLPVEAELPLMGIVSRMDQQKGIDLAVRALASLKSTKFQAVILGAGDSKLEQAVRDLQNARPNQIQSATRFDPHLARLIYGGSDLLLMPSRYEPCGLAQMIAMRYGCLPLAHAVGGLRDTVNEDVGFLFEKAAVTSLASAIRRVLKVYPDRERWMQMQKAGMARDFSWDNSARQYFSLYKKLVHSVSSIL